MATETSRSWSFDGRPSKLEMGVAVVFVVEVGLGFSFVETVYWGAIAIGFVVFIVAVGAATASITATKIGTWFRKRGAAIRVLVVGLIAVAVWVGLPLIETPDDLLYSLSNGALLGFAAIVLVRSIRSLAKVAGDD